MEPNIDSSIVPPVALNQNQNVDSLNKKAVYWTVVFQIVAFVVLCIGLYLKSINAIIAAALIIIGSLNWITFILHTATSGGLNDSLNSIVIKGMFDHYESPALILPIFIFGYWWLSIVGYKDLISFNTLLPWVVIILIIFLINYIIMFYSKRRQVVTSLKFPLLIQITTYLVWTLIIFIIAKLGLFNTFVS